MDGRPSLDLRPPPDSLAALARLDDSDGARRDGTLQRVDEDEEAYELEDTGLLGRERSSSDSLDQDQRRKHGEADEGEEGSFQAILRKTIPTTDDPTLPTLTWRAIVLGSVFCVLGAASSQLWYFRSNAPNFSDFFVVLVTYPLGNLCARHVPQRRFLGLDTSPGPFSIKEHILIGVLAHSGNGAAYASDILAVLSLYMNRELHALAGITLLLTTQLIGFGLSGLLQDLLVKPESMIWPNSLVTANMYQTLHRRQGDDGNLKFFLAVFGTTFLYQFLPGWVAPTLTSIPLLCLVSDSAPLRILGSGYDGFGFLDFSFDWSAIGQSGPLYTPSWALACYFAGLAGMMWVLTPIIYFGDIWDAKSFPSAVSAGLFNSNFTKFDVMAVLAPDLTLNETAWETSGPLLLTPYFAITYTFSFAALTSVITHVALFHGDDIKKALWSKKGVEQEDVHNRLMRAYEDVPKRWYWSMILVNFAASALLVLFAPLQTPIWCLVLAILLALVFLVPVGIVSAASGTTVGLNVITELLYGLIRPGKPVGNVFFKCFGYMALSQALDLTGDLKMALYLKVPYKEMFLVQVWGTIIGAVTNYVVLGMVLDQKRPYLDGTLVDPTGQWTGRAPAVFYSASIVWGAVSPRRFFAGKYGLLYLGFPLGVAVPIITYFLHKRYPGRGFNKIVFPIVCSGATLVPQAPSNVLLTGIIVAYVFHGPIRRLYPRWTEKRILTLSAALDAGTSLNGLAVYGIFTALLGGATFATWWGNPDEMPIRGESGSGGGK